MAREYVTEGREMLDLIVFRAYPRTIQDGVLERVLEANSHRLLAQRMPVLPPGTTITLPDIEPSEAFARVKTQKLWD